MRRRRTPVLDRLSASARPLRRRDGARAADVPVARRHPDGPLSRIVRRPAQRDESAAGLRGHAGRTPEGGRLSHRRDRRERRRRSELRAGAGIRRLRRRDCGAEPGHDCAGGSAAAGRRGHRRRDGRGWPGSRRRASRQAPWFLWVHYYDPHLPYDAPAAFAALAPGRPYDGEIAYVDAELGGLLSAIDRERTAVVVTSDHGEALGDHGEPDHGFFLYDATLRVPLIVAAPGLAPRVVTEQVRHLDIAPTIAALAGVSAQQGERPGESLVPLLRGQTRREVPVSLAESWYPRLHFGWSELRSARVGEWKYVAAPRPELYDLRVDRTETRNVAGDRASVAARLAADVSRITSRFTQGDGVDAARARAARRRDGRAPAGTRLCRGVCAGDGGSGHREPGRSHRGLPPVSRPVQPRARRARTRARRRRRAAPPAPGEDERPRVRSAPLSGERLRGPEAVRPRARRVRRRVAAEPVAVDAALRGGEGVVVQRGGRGGRCPHPARPGAGSAVELRVLHARRDPPARGTVGGGGRGVYARHRAQRPRPPGAREPRGGGHAPRQPRRGARASTSA